MVRIMKMNACKVTMSRWNTAHPHCSAPPASPHQNPPL